MTKDEALKLAYEKGWRQAAVWSSRDDLLYDIGSLSYRVDRARSLATLPEQLERQWVGLTDAEAAECWSTSAVSSWKAIEAKLKEMNT